MIESLSPAAALAIGRVKLPDVAADISALFATVAKYGHDDDAAASRAYLGAIAACLPGADAAVRAAGRLGGALDRALPKLDRLAPAGKELVVGGLTRAISEDGRVDVAEAELLRVVCAALHCPLPPLLADTL